MIQTRSILVLLPVGVLVLAARAMQPVGGASYTIIDLGTLGGFSSVALGINDLGQVVGGADRADGARHAFLWTDGEMTDLGTLPPHTQSEAWDVNNVGQVVGITTNTGSITKAFLWEDGEMTDLGDLTGVGAPTDAFGINDAGQVVGSSKVSLTEVHAFLWENGVMTDLGTLGGTHSLAWDINESAQVVGESFTGSGEHAFLWEDGVMSDLGSLGGGNSQAMGINVFGEVVGRAVNADFVVTAFLWQDGEMTDLGALTGVGESAARAINNRGQVIGSPPFLYDPPDDLRDVHDLIPPDSGWFSLRPRDINDAGQIVGAGTFQGARRAFLMSPVPPLPPIPAVSEWGLIVMALLILTIAKIATARRRRSCS